MFNFLSLTKSNMGIKLIIDQISFKYPSDEILNANLLNKLECNANTHLKKHHFGQF